MVHGAGHSGVSWGAVGWVWGRFKRGGARCAHREHTRRACQSSRAKCAGELQVWEGKGMGRALGGTS